jgi:AcrR family transcriptional regulator
MNEVRALTGKGAQTRARLLRAAAEEMVEARGQLDVAAVADRAGTSIGLTYRYFPSKGALAAAVVDDFYDRHDQVLMARIDADSWAARERRRLELVVAFHYAEPLAAVAVGHLSSDPEVVATLQTRQDHQAALVAALLDQGQAAGVIRPEVDPSLASAMVMGAVHEAIRLALAAGTAVDPRQLTDQIAGFLQAALLVRPGED